MNYLQKKIEECETAIKYKNLADKELSAVRLDLANYREEYNGLKLELANVHTDDHC